MNSKEQYSRVDQAIAKWRGQEHRYVQQYGNNVYNDRDFMRVRASAYKMIHDQFRNKKLSFEEKLDLKILQGQMKQMNEQIYPNKYLRITIGIMKLLSRPLLAIGKLAANILSYLVTGQPYFKNNKKPYLSKTTDNEKQAQAKREQTKNAVHEQQVQRRISNPRVLTSPQNGQGLKR